MGWERSGEDTPRPQQHMEGVLYHISCPRAAAQRAEQGSLTWGLSPQHHPLPGVRDIPDDSAEGPGEAGRLASHLHHLHPQRHHGQPGQCHLPAIQGRGEGWGGSTYITPNPTSPQTLTPPQGPKGHPCLSLSQQRFGEGAAGCSTKLSAPGRGVRGWCPHGRGTRGISLPHVWGFAHDAWVTRHPVSMCMQGSRAGRWLICWQQNPARL